MKKRYIVTEKQLREYVEKKMAEKTFFNIVEDLHKNNKFLNESTLIKKANQLVVDNYKRKGFLSPLVEDMLKNAKILNEKQEII